MAKLARKRPSPLRSGTRKVWAAGVVYALGQANFLFDPQTRPYATAEALSEAFAVAKSTMSSKAKLIRDGLKITYFSAEFLRADQIAGNPLIWMITIDGLPCDARSLPVELQAQVYQLGLSEVTRIEKEQDTLAQKAGFKDREAYYAERKRLFPPTPWTDEIRADYLRRYNAAVANNRSLLPAFFNNLPEKMVPPGKGTSAEPYIRVPTPGQQARLDALARRHDELEPHLSRRPCMLRAESLPPPGKTAIDITRKPLF